MSETETVTLAEKEKVAAPRPDFTIRVERGPRGIMLYAKSAALCAHLAGLAEGRTTTASNGRAIHALRSAQRNVALFGFSEHVSTLMLDAALSDGVEVKIAEVMSPSAAKDTVRDIIAAFGEYVRDYMSALRITGTVTIDERLTRRPSIAEV